MSKRERLRETMSSIIERIGNRYRRQKEETPDLEEKTLLAQARKAIKKRYGRRQAREILKQLRLVISFPPEFEVRGIKGVVLFGEEIARYEPGGIDKSDTPRFKRTVRLKDRDDPSRGIMIFINNPNPRYPSESKEPSISYVGMEFFSTPGTEPSHPWPTSIPIVVARGQMKTGSNQSRIAESIMIGVLPDVKIVKTNVIFPSPRIDQFLYVTALHH